MRRLIFVLALSLLPAWASAQVQYPTTFTDKVISPTYATGWTGTGFLFDFDKSYPSQSFLEVDRLTVRGTMSVYELLIHQIRATNGSVFIANTGKAKTVTDNGGGSYTIETETAHGFAANDLIRAQRFTGTGVYQSDLTVTGVGSTTEFTATLRATYAPPVAGMEYVRLGNTTDADRQGSIYLTADDTNAPYLSVLAGVASFADWNSAAKTQERFGNLNGACGYSTNVFGLCAGAYVNGSSFITVAAATGVTMSSRIAGSDYERFHLAADGSGHLASSAIAWDTAGTLSVDGSVLVAGSVSAGSVNAGLQDLGADAWSVVTNGGGEVGTVGAQATSWIYGLGNGVLIADDFKRIGARSLKITSPAAADNYSYERIAVEAGATYEMSVWIKTSALPVADPGGGAYIHIDPAATVIETRGCTACPGGYGIGIPADDAAHDWTLCYERFKPSTGSLIVFIQLGYGGGQSGSAWFDGLTIRRFASIYANDIVANTITASQIAANTITADRMNVSTLDAISATLGSVVVGAGGSIRQGQTAYNTGIGWWIGDVASTPKLSIGNPAGSYLTWDGSDLTYTSTNTTTSLGIVEIPRHSGAIDPFRYGFSSTSTYSGLWYYLDNMGHPEHSHMELLSPDDPLRLVIGPAGGSQTSYTFTTTDLTTTADLHGGDIYGVVFHTSGGDGCTGVPDGSTNGIVTSCSGPGLVARVAALEEEVARLRVLLDAARDRRGGADDWVSKTRSGPADDGGVIGTLAQRRISKPAGKQ